MFSFVSSLSRKLTYFTFKLIGFFFGPILFIDSARSKTFLNKSSLIKSFNLPFSDNFATSSIKGNYPIKGTLRFSDNTSPPPFPKG